MGAQKREPSAEEAAALSTLTNSEAARRFGVYRATVARWRRELGNPPAPKAERPAQPEPTPEERREHHRARAEAKADRAEARKLWQAYDAAEAYRQTIADYAPLLTVPKLERVPVLADPPRHTWVLVLSDLHVGQKTKSEHTGGLFEQTLDRTREQIRNLFQTLELLHAIARKSIHLERLVVLMLGDLVEGDGMRPRQAREIDGLVTKQTIDVVDLLSWFLQQAMSLFPVVEVHNVGGNHDRVSQKAGTAGLGELGYHDTYAWLAGEVLKRMFKPAIDAERMEFTNWEGFFGGSIIAEKRFVFEHGASFRTSTGSYGGIGYYPIANAARRYREMLDGADFVVMGHFHQANCLSMGRGWQVLNGALPPSTSWVQSTFKTVGMPSQNLLDLHPKYGLVGFRPIYLPHDGLAKPGAFWDRLKPAA